MLNSKATVALMRFKEIDKKYKIRQVDNDRRRFSVSAESSLSSSERNYWYTEREQPRQETLPKPKTSRLDIRMPETHFVKAYDKNEEANNNHYRHDHHVKEISSKVSSISMENDESGKFNDTGVDSPKSVPSNNSKMSIDVPLSVTVAEEVTEISEQKGKQFNELSEIVATDVINDEECVTVKNQSYECGTETDDTLSESTIKDSLLKDSPIMDSSVKASRINIASIKTSSIKGSPVQTLSNTDISEELTATDKPPTGYDDTFEELSSATMKTADSKFNRCKQISSEIGVVNEEHNGNEELTSARSSPPRFTTLSEHRGSVRNPGDTEVIELISPNITESESQCEVELNKELSDYVKKIEETNIDPINLSPVCLLKSPTSAVSSVSRNRKKFKRRVKSPHRHPINNIDKTMTTQLLISNRKKSPTENSNVVEDKKESSRKISSRINVASILEEDPKVEAVNTRVVLSKKLKSKREVDKCSRKGKGNVEYERQDGNDLARRKSAMRPIVNLEVNRGSSRDAAPETVDAEFDVTRVLRKLNRDAINAVSGHCSKMKPPSGNQKSSKNRLSNSGHVDKDIPVSTIFTKISKDSKNIVQREHFRANRDKTKLNMSKKKKSKKKTKKQQRKATERLMDGEKCIRFDSKHVQLLKKRIATLKLQQDKETIRNYVLKMRAMRTGLGLSKLSQEKLDGYNFMPLEFPKIAAFSLSDDIQKNSTGNYQLNEFGHKLSTIRQWIKDQYILYRDYSNLAKIMNSEYVSIDHLNIKKGKPSVGKDPTGMK